MSAEQTGFRRLLQSGIELQVNQRASMDLVMEVGDLSEVVRVEATQPLLESQSSVLGSVIPENQVRDLPLNGRNFVQLAILSPGVTGTGFGARGTIMSGTRPDDQRAGTELFVNGNRESSNNYLYDGIDNNDRLTLALVSAAVRGDEGVNDPDQPLLAEPGRHPAGRSTSRKMVPTRSRCGLRVLLRNSALPPRTFFLQAADNNPPFGRIVLASLIASRSAPGATFFFGDYDFFRSAFAHLRLDGCRRDDVGGVLRELLGRESTTR